jgi:UDPglucose 6-dehydrogenase
LKREMAQPIIVDLRNIYRPAEMAQFGFTYESVGRPQTEVPTLPETVLPN